MTAAHKWESSLPHSKKSTADVGNSYPQPQPVPFRVWSKREPGVMLGLDYVAYALDGFTWRQTTGKFRSLVFITRHKAYLRTKEWKALRSTVLKLAGHRCASCHEEKRRLEVHHKTYRRWMHEAVEDLEAVCHTCHLKRHGVAKFGKA